MFLSKSIEKRKHMGIKGKRKRERERQQKHELAVQNGEVSDASDADDVVVMGDGPFRPPPGGAPKMSKSELFRMQDDEYLESIREEHKNRKQSHLNARPRKKTREELELEASPLPLMEHFTSEGLALEQLNQETQKKNVATGPRFHHPLIGLNSDVADALVKEGFLRMTRIQERVIPLALEGYDLLGQAKTGSGKTLAFCIPVLHSTIQLVGKSPKSLVAMMLAPTKELCVQTHQVLRAVCQHIPKKVAQYSVQLITGGTNVAEERRELLGGVNIVVGTPGRLNDHVKHCKGWVLSSLKFLILDEADRMLADGFQRDLDSIIGATPKSRQTFLFSATNSKSVNELARLSLSKTPLFIATKGEAPTFVDQALENLSAPPYRTFEDFEGEEDAPTGDNATPHEAGEDIPSSLRQFCHVTPAEDRLRALYVFVKRVARESKAMVFCSTVASTIFHCQMMGSVGFHNEVLMLHGHMKHRQRIQTFEAFNTWPTGVLFCTDVAARGLDIPNVSWILQYDPPLDPTEYVHRIGRTARAGNVGNSLIFLSPEESGFVRYLTKFGIHMEKYPMPESLPKIQEKLEHVLQLDPIVAKSAVYAYRAHVGAYQSHILKETFDVGRLDLDGLATAFALTQAPHVSLPKSAAEETKKEYVKGKLKSLNNRTKEAVRSYEQLKTKQQWTDDGSFVGMSRPSKGFVYDAHYQ